MNKTRAVAYVRVSTASDAQLHSFEFQEQYWRDKFTDSPDTEMVGIYADLGISGCSIKKRPQFLAMMQDARAHAFDQIHTKSVSRFARNTVELLSCVRELRDLGIEVIFEKENIRTLDPTSELFLSIAATIAENDLQVDSERQRWSIDHRIRNGWISIGAVLYGYKMTKDNQLEIVPEEAEVVRRVFQMYIAGIGADTIARTLNEEGHKTALGNEWIPSRVIGIIDNEKFMGDCIMGKSVIVDGEKKDNKDGRYGKRYYLENTHEGIVSREVWYKAQEVRKQRSLEKLHGADRPTYPFTSIIECGQCHNRYQHKVNASGLKWASDIWACRTALKKGVKACDCTRIKDSVLQEKFVEAYNEFVTTRPVGKDMAAANKALAKLREEERELAYLALSHLIPADAYRTEQSRMKAEIYKLLAQIRNMKCKDVHEDDFQTITEFDPAKVEKFITKVIVSKGTVTFVFYNGAQISKTYTNGPSGNRPGWNKKEA